MTIARHKSKAICQVKILRLDGSNVSRRPEICWCGNCPGYATTAGEDWRPEYDVPTILREIHDANAERWVTAA
jgi:hypothetical protein